MEKAEKYACKVKKFSLNKHEAWLYYTSCYLKLLGCVLGQTFFPKHTLENIDRPAIRAFTSKCEYNYNMAYTIRDSPKRNQTHRNCYRLPSCGYSTSQDGTTLYLKILLLHFLMLSQGGFLHFVNT
eukprot:2215357-Ditylum_brightwellii.AAC.1